LASAQFRGRNRQAPRTLTGRYQRPEPRSWRALLQAIFRGYQMLVGALVTFLVVILILYLINLLPLDGRAKQIARVVVIILGIISLLKYIAVI
jgi:hypothetical protein